MRRSLVLVLAATATSLVVGSALPAAVASPVPAAAPTATTIPSGRFALGDSVMLGAKPNLVARGFVVDATSSRQFSAAPAIIATKARLGVLKRNVIIALGTNGTISRSDCTAAVKAAGPNRRVFLVTNRVPRTWRAGNNLTLAKCANDPVFAASRVHLIDWYAYSAGTASWFYSDGFHLRPTGKSAYAILIDAKLDALGR